MSRGTTWAIVPVQRFREAKTRLSPRLSAAQRQQLARAMLLDLLDALRATAQFDTVCIASDEAALGDIGCRVWADPPGATLNEAIGAAVRRAVAEGATTCCVFHADLPLVNAEAIAGLLRAHRACSTPAVTLVPDRHGDGTNVIACTPAKLIRFRYGRGSFAAHRQAATNAGIDATIVCDAALTLDIDVPADLDALITLADGDAAVTGSRTGALLLRRGMDGGAPRRTA